MTDSKYYLPFAQFSGIGPHKFSALVNTFGSARKAYEASNKELAKIIGPITLKKFEDFREKFDLNKYEKELSARKLKFVILIDKNYPVLLKKIPNPPFLLFVKGDENLLSKNETLAIVGTRKMTSYGQEVTDKFSSELSENFVIVSGMALGVDGQAHKSCMESGGKTVAVLGNGVDLPFPSSNKYLYDRILERDGAIISEFPPGEPPSKGTFPSRNRIIAGMSRGVLVTQGAADSGSLITANLGLKFGRKVFAVPGPITSSLSAAPLRLIEKGAKLVVDPEDILKELGVNPSSRKDNKIKGETKEEQKIIDLLEDEELSFDEIGKRLKFDVSKLSTILSMMEIKGVIKNIGGSYSLNFN